MKVLALGLSIILLAFGTGLVLEYLNVDLFSIVSGLAILSIITIYFTVD